LRLRLPLVALVLLTAVACSSSSSGGGTVVSPPGPAESSATGEGAVDAVLTEVLAGLRAATSIAPGSDLGDDAAALRDASTRLLTASAAVVRLAAPPKVLVFRLRRGLHTVGDLLGRAGECLKTQSGAATPDQTKCLPPLRRAEHKDAAIAHDLISLSAYGSVSPKTFERQLVAALRGQG
jgi:hypothetical protein